jgi:hypothetical protein
VLRHDAAFVEVDVGEHHALAGHQAAGELGGDLFLREVGPAVVADGGRCGGHVLGGGVLGCSAMSHTVAHCAGAVDAGSAQRPGEARRGPRAPSKPVTPRKNQGHADFQSVTVLPLSSAGS